MKELTGPCGLDFVRLRALVQVYDTHGSLLALLDAAKAEADGAVYSQGARIVLSERRADRTELKRGSSHRDHLLRRIARSSPSALDAYKAGGISAAAAARAAGISVGEKIWLGQPETVAKRIVAKGGDYARSIIAEIEEELRRRSSP